MNLLGKLVEKSAIQSPNRPAVINEDHSTVTFASLQRRINKVGCFLQAQHVQKGDHVIIWLPNTLEWIVSYWALMKLGAVGILVNDMAKQFEIEHILADAKPVVIITNAKFMEALQKYSLPDLAWIKILVVDGSSEAKALFLDQPDEPTLELPLTDLDPATSPAAVIYTGALAGVPMGAVLSQRNFYYATLQTLSVTLPGAHDCFSTLLPFYHGYGLIGSLGMSMVREIPVYITGRFSTIRFQKILKDSPVTCFLGVPLMYGLLTKYLQPGTDLSRIRTWIVGGDSTPREIFQACQEKYGITIREGYGLTEASPSLTYNGLTGVVKFGSVGTPLPNVTVEILDEQGQPLPPNKEGQVVVQGPNVFMGYLNQPEKTAEILRNGKLYTPDRGYLDEDGFLFLTGRLKTFYISNGLNVYPREVEQYIERHPDVIKAEVDHTRNPLQGDIINVKVKVKPESTLTDDILSDWCMDRFASYKIPKMIQLER